MVVVGYQHQVIAPCLLRDGNQRINLALPRLYAVYGVCDLYELDYLSMPHAAEVYVARLVLVIVYLRVVVRPPSQELEMFSSRQPSSSSEPSTPVKYEMNAGSDTYSFSLRMRSAGFAEYRRTSETRYDSTRYPM